MASSGIRISNYLAFDDSLPNIEYVYPMPRITYAISSCSRSETAKARKQYVLLDDDAAGFHHYGTHNIASAANMLVGVWLLNISLFLPSRNVQSPSVGTLVQKAYSERLQQVGMLAQV